MRPGQTPSEVCARVMTALDPVLQHERPDLVLVQGDTTTALAGALAAFHRMIPVGHIEAGLRSGNRTSPFPEEMNRRLVTRIARAHFAATPRNVFTLRREGVPADDIVLTGNPVVDALGWVLARSAPSCALLELVERLRGYKLVVLTTHRRESFGGALRANLRALRAFVTAHDDVALVFPVHPNPAVRESARSILGDSPRIALVDPLDYPSFIHLLARAWLIVSDSGGVQEEAPTLGKPVLILRENTERPEAVEAGVARLVGGSAERLREMLEDVYTDGAWLKRVAATPNPFGRGDAGTRIADAIARLFDRVAAAEDVRAERRAGARGLGQAREVGR